MIMKKIFKISLVMVGLISTLNANAENPKLLLDLKKANGKKVSLTLKEMKKVKLSIYDGNNDVIFDENVNGANLARTYDLSSLPEGDYFIKAQSDAKISKYKIEVKGKNAFLTSESFSEVLVPSFDYNLESKKVTINHLNQKDNSPITIDIYDDNNDLVYTKTSSVNEFVKTYDLNKLFSNKCTFIVNYKGEIFEKTISL